MAKMKKIDDLIDLSFGQKKVQKKPKTRLLKVTEKPSVAKQIRMNARIGKYGRKQ